MKKTISLLLMLVLCLSLCACGGEAQPAQTAAAESPFAEIGDAYTLQLPIYTLSTVYSSLGDDTYTYGDMEFDEQGNLISWSKKENKFSPQKYTATYNEAGQRTSVVYHSSLYGYTETYTYDNLGRLRECYKTEPDDPSFYQRNTYLYGTEGTLIGETVESSSDFYDGGVYKYTFTANEKGWIVANTDIALDSDYAHDNQHTYNDAGQLVKSVSKTIDEGKHKYTYETTAKYDLFGFPIASTVDNSYDYKGNTTSWETTSTYAATGSMAVACGSDTLLKPATSWMAYAENAALPTANSVIAGLIPDGEQNGVYRYAIPAGEATPPKYEVFEIMQGVDELGYIDLRAYSVQDAANQVLWRYQAVLEQLLQLETQVQEDKMLIVKDGVTLGNVTIQFENGTYYLVVRIG